MKTVIATIGVLVCTIWGCTGSIIELGDSPFEPGIYSGPTTCSFTSSINGVVVESFVETFEDTTLTIGGSGLPTYEAQEVAPGLSYSTDFGFAFISGVVTDLAVANNGVLVGSDVTFDFDLGDAGTFQLVGVQDDNYLPGQSGVISNSFSVGVGGLRPDGNTLTLVVGCTAELVRAGS